MEKETEQTQRVWRCMHWQRVCTLERSKAWQRKTFWDEHHMETTRIILGDFMFVCGSCIQEVGYLGPRLTHGHEMVSRIASFGWKHRYSSISDERQLIIVQSFMLRHCREVWESISVTCIPRGYGAVVRGCGTYCVVWLLKRACSFGLAYQGVDWTLIFHFQPGQEQFCPWVRTSMASRQLLVFFSIHMRSWLSVYHQTRICILSSAWYLTVES